MKEHTFQKGDRIIHKEHGGGTYVGLNKLGHAMIMREDLIYGASGEYWTTSIYCVKHDRDFRVGDWVRYEGVYETNTSKLNGRTGRVDSIKDNGVAYVNSFYPLISGYVFLDNLVKIAPPQEEKGERIGFAKYPDLSNTVTIKHPEHGRVEGVSAVGSFGWIKHGAYYFHCDGWEEVKPKKWVDVTPEYESCNHNNSIYLRANERFAYYRTLVGGRMAIEREVAW